MARSSGTRKGNGAGHGPGKGDGWGGQANGASKAPPFSSDDQHRGAHTAAAIDGKAARIERLLNNLERLALGAEREETQVTATVAALNRLDGLPVQKVDATVTRATISDRPMTEDEWTAAYGMVPAAGASEGTH